MLTQELLSRILGTSLPALGCDTLLVPLAALVALDNAEYETLWDAANHICDRYLPRLKQD